jgi:hypothetical protein
VRKERLDRGSALLIATVVVLLAVGIGGAFVSISFAHSRGQAQLIEADEAMTMCDAGLERARQALAFYRGGKQWTVDQIFQYSSNNYKTMYVNYYAALQISPPSPTPDPTLPPDPLVLKADYVSRRSSLQFTNYNPALYGGQSVNINVWNNAIWGNNNTTDPNVAQPGMPFDHINPGSTDPAANVVVGWNLPFHKGAIHIHIRNNSDSATLDPSGNAGSPTHDTDSLIMVTVTATLPSGLQRQIDGTVQWPPPPPPGGVAQFTALGAVVANDSVNTNGNTTIDGRDYAYSTTTGASTTLTGNPGVFGVVSGNAIGVGGSSGVGGNGSPPPAKGAATGSTAQNFVYPGGYPPTPDALMNQPSGTLKATAQAQGTYFSDEASYTAFLNNSTNNGKIPDHAILYLEFTPGNGAFELGSGNTLSSILIVHTDSYTGTISQVHGNFTGALFADSVVRVNAGTNITGMVQLFSPTSSSSGNVLGNGNSNIRFSSAALNDLPSANGGGGSAPALPLMASRRIL